jgi:type IV secretion system protein TrbL
MGVCDVPVVSTVCHAVGKAASSVVSAPFDWLAEGVGNAAEWMFKGVWQLFNSTTLVNVTEPNYLKVYDVLFGVAIFLMLLFFSLQLITGLIHRDPGALQRAAIGLAKSVLGSFLVVTVTGLALEITDELCVGIIQASGNTLAEMGGKIAALAAGIGAISVSAPGAGAVIIIFLGCLAITGAAIVWFSLLIRKSLLLVAVVLAPIALSGQSWDAARGWFSRWASFVVALIVSKLVMVVIFLVAINQMNAPLNLDLSSIANPVAGIVLMFIAAFAPYMAYKFISFIGFDLHHAMSAESEAKQAVNRPVPAPAASRLGSMRKILGGTSDGGEDGGTGGSGGGGTPGGQQGGPSAGGAADGASQGAGAAPGAGAVGGPLGLAAVAGAQALASAGKAGPAAGRAVARSAEQHADAGQKAAGQTSTQTPDAAGRATPPPVPRQPSPSAAAQPQRPAQPGPAASEPPSGPAPNALPPPAPTVPPPAGQVDPNPGASEQHTQPPARPPGSDLSGEGS